MIKTKLDALSWLQQGPLDCLSTEFVIDMSDMTLGGCSGYVNVDEQGTSVLELHDGTFINYEDIFR